MPASATARLMLTNSFQSWQFVWLWPLRILGLRGLFHVCWAFFVVACYSLPIPKVHMKPQSETSLESSTTPLKLACAYPHPKLALTPPKPPPSSSSTNPTLAGSSTLNPKPIGIPVQTNLNQPFMYSNSTPILNPPQLQPRANLNLPQHALNPSQRSPEPNPEPTLRQPKPTQTLPLNRSRLQMCGVGSNGLVGLSCTSLTVTGFWALAQKFAGEVRGVLPGSGLGWHCWPKIQCLTSKEPDPTKAQILVEQYCCLSTLLHWSN